MIDTSRAIRAKCAAAGKVLVSYVAGQACSAAYALACSASRIVTSETGVVGSIGVINCRVDVTEADRAMGTRFAIVTSGARKADGHPHAPISEGELAATQGLVDSLALTFFDLVGELRGLSRADVAGLQAGLFHGDAAVRKRLADRVQSFGGLLASLASADQGEPMASNKKYEDARAALGELAGGEGEEAVKARRALAAMDEEEKPEAAEEKPADEAAEEKPPEDARAEGPPAEDEEKKPAAKATVSAATAGAVAAHSMDLAARVARLEAQNEGLQRREFLSSRPDLSPDLVRVLATRPLADVRAIVGAIPAPKSPKLGDKAAASRVTATAGDVGAIASRLPPAEKAQLDREMGLSAQRSIGVEKTVHKLVLGAPVDVNVNANRKGGVTHG
jgi:ClpP class serine protease